MKTATYAKYCPNVWVAKCSERCEKDEIIEAISYISNCKLSGKVQNALVDSICQEEKYLVDWIDRLNATCTHQLDFCRSIISKNKEELRLSNLGREFK